MLSLDSAVSSISGVGSVRAEKLNKLGIYTVRDLIYLAPRAYEKRGDVRPLAEYSTSIPSSFLLTVATEVRSSTIKRGFTISKFRAFDESGSVEIVFFNAPYIKDVFHIGSQYRFWAKPVYSQKKLQFVNPKYEPYIEGVPLPDFVPIYPQTEGLSSKQIDALIKTALNSVAPTITDPLPENIRLKYELPTIQHALLNLHFPSAEEELTRSFRRLAFDEMFYFGIGISMANSRKSTLPGIKFSPCSLDPLITKLPYELTSDQKSAVNDIYRDTVLGNNGNVTPMARIIVGDVGCGKTVCATAALYIAAKSKYQSAFMVPTEILARQHYAELKELFEGLGIEVALLLGASTQKEKRTVYEKLKNGEIDVVVGTHALLSEKVEFKNLALIVTDEQHRFGVAQRAHLKEHTLAAHVLVMSATPIPRTLALTMYGDLDISRIKEMPKNRQTVDTFVVNEGYRSRINDFIKKQVSLGGQCYIVCPAIEAQELDEDAVIYDSETRSMLSYGALNLKNATEYFEDIQKALPHISIGLLHGKMKPAEKDAVMRRFASGEISVIVSTTVIEVGINVPNATLIIIENAERFGLSQLHQLRGRVGRGTKKSYCILVSDLTTQKAKDRLEIIRTTHNGFEISEKDLVLRGPGDFISSNSSNNLRQSGGFDFKFAQLSENSELITSAFAAAKAIIEQDSDLSDPQHAIIKKEADRFIVKTTSTIS